MNDPEAIVFRTKSWVWLYLLCFTGIVLTGGWVALSHIVLHGADLRSTLVLLCTLAFLAVIVWMTASVPVRVVFDVPRRLIRAYYLLRPVRSFQMEKVDQIEWRANQYAKQLGLLLHFQDGQRLLIPPASYDSRINPVIAEIRRMTSP